MGVLSVSIPVLQPTINSPQPPTVVPLNHKLTLSQSQTFSFYKISTYRYYQRVPLK